MMAQRISDVLKIDSMSLKKERAFNGFVDINSKFYIDPRLLDIVITSELRNSRKTFENFFFEIRLILLFRLNNAKAKFFLNKK